jgi:tetratricopeptide (TPR) repeat protein
VGRWPVARSKSKTPGPGSIADTVAMLAIWARPAAHGFARVEYHSEYARAEADRRLGEALLREEVPYHHVELPVRVTPSQAGRYLLEHLEAIESGAVSITGFATAVAEEDRREFLAILSVRREVLAEFGLCQIWWLTPAFLDAMIGIAPDLDSWFMTRLHLEEEFPPPAEEPDRSEPIRPTVPMYRIGEALRLASGLVERFQRAKDTGTQPSELVEMAASAARAIIEVGAPKLTRGLADQLVGGLTDACRSKLSDCPSTVRSLNSLVRLLVRQGRVKEATPLIDRAGALIEQDERQDHPDVARDLHNLAGLLYDTNRLDRAEVLLRRAVAIDERVLGPWHPSVARHLNTLAWLLWKKGRLREAEVLCRRMLTIAEKNVGPDHPEFASHLSNLAILLRTENRLAEAEPLLRRALAINERWLGPDDPSVAHDLSHLAVLLRAMKRLDEAGAMLP